MTPLRQLMVEEMQIRNLAPHTRTSYLQQISQFACHFGKSPELLGPAEIRAYVIGHIPPGQAAAGAGSLGCGAPVRAAAMRSRA